ncbi:hypothetical protein B0H15DRAFT_940675 [Mycena belliarum]|uniref:Zinc finger Mcm10/DnaG-type domain-containing protein n=1 Tax=Mycena belliarum TaxID=1033014 RepID=A0AAD6XMC6_9AGAR|nr:hypothetical protein B0H15DRAFT_940675 [Mycena belliae]
MESVASRERADRQKNEEIKCQIAALQAQLLDSDPESPSRVPGPSSPKRRKLEPVFLVPPTPSPKKRRPDAKNAAGPRHALKSLNSDATFAKPGEEFIPVKPAASNFLAKLASTSRGPLDVVETETLVRSSAFTDVPHAPEPTVSSSTQRDDRLAIIENLEIGPVEHTPSFDDPHFQKLEPNSGIRLVSRIISHDDLQDHLRGRYYLSPSRLYSAVRLLPDKQGYDVPVSGDWITIAVVAERGPYKYSKAPVGITNDDEDGKKGKAKPPPKPSGKKFVNLKLVDFGAPARSASSATGGKAVIRGDALLSLLLFESDGFDMMPQDEEKTKKVYRGGSRGAFEEMCDLKEGDVVALLNPRILKPFQRSTDKPHPTTNILAITPESASSIMIIGRSKDLGLCGAIKRDGKACGSWCDRRLSDVCEWHVQYAVEQRRAGRPEFSVGTSGLSTTAVRKRKAEYDPRRKWGLKPLEEASTGATYLVAGHIINNSSGVDLRDSMYVSEKMGREGQAKASRKLAGREDARVLKALLGRDSEGMKTVMKAREVGLAEKAELAAAKHAKGKDKQKAGAGGSTSKPTPKQDGVAPRKNAYTPEMLKNLGFDPTLKSGHPRHGDSVGRKKSEDLAALLASRNLKTITLGPRPGEKIRSGVMVPASALQPKPGTKPKRPSELAPLQDGSDDEMPAAISVSKLGPQEGNVEMVDLDD